MRTAYPNHWPNWMTEMLERKPKPIADMTEDELRQFIKDPRGPDYKQQRQYAQQLLGRRYANKGQTP